MSRMQRRRGVDDDILELAIYLSDRNLSVAERFVDAVQQSLKDLSRMPGAGSRKRFQEAELRGVRTWRVRGFPKYLIYYLPIDDGIDVLAILHGARDARVVLRERAERA